MPVTIKKIVTYQLNGKSVSQKTPGANRVESANWYLFGRDLSGAQIRKATGTADYSEAEKQARRLEVDLERGASTADNLKSLKYEDLRADYLLENPSRANDEHVNIIDEFFKNVRVTAIGKRIEQFITHRRGEGKADATIKRNLKPLIAMLRLASKKDRIPKVPYVPSLSDGNQRSGFIEADTFVKLRGEVPEHLRPLLTFVYYTGCRIGATLKITWGMVHRPACDSITIPGHVQKNGKPLPPLPLVGPLEEVSTSLKALYKAKSNGVIKMRLDSESVFDARNLRKEWNKAVAKLGLGSYDKKTGLREGLTIHDFRRSAARNLRRSGVGESTAMLITGHKTNSMFKRYAITSEDETTDALIKVGDYAKQRIASASK